MAARGKIAAKAASLSPNSRAIDMTTVANFTRLPVDGVVLDPARRQKEHFPTQHKPQPGSPRHEPKHSEPEKRFINWANVIWLAILHVGCLAAPFFFSWEAVALTVVLHWLTGGIGIC